MKRNKTLILPLVLLLTALLLAGCNGGKKIEPNFQLSATEISLPQGAAQALSLTDKKEIEVGAYTVTWASDTEAVATVDQNGTVSALGVGVAKITATVSAEKGTAVYTCTVTVTQNTTPLTGLAFASNIYALGQGQSIDLNNEVVFYPANAADKALLWSSSNPDIATVANGVVSPVSEGVTTITATDKTGTILTTCMIRVSEIVIDPTDINFEENWIQISVGDEIELIPTVTPENATGYSILWSSTDPSVATVFGGTVTAVSEGSATIVARLSIGGGDLFAECVVDVVAGTTVGVPATKVQLSPSLISTEAGADLPYEFTLKVTPVNYTDEPRWYTNRPDLITIDAKTGVFRITGKITAETAILVSCDVGDVTGTAVVHVKPAKPKLEIFVNEGAEEIYDQAPLNQMALAAMLENSDDLPQVTWSVSDNSVATVDQNGIVTAKKAGTCTVTATLKSDETVKATFEVKVKKADYLSVKVGEKVTIDASLLPADPYDWSFYAPSLELDETNKTVKGLQPTQAEPQIITCRSQSSGKLYQIKVYILAN